MMVGFPVALNFQVSMVYAVLRSSKSPPSILRNISHIVISSPVICISYWGVIVVMTLLCASSVSSPDWTVFCYMTISLVGSEIRKLWA
eukprot:11174377-Ditylum_brightwellii.AAC.1